MKNNWDVSYEYHLEKYSKTDPFEVSQRTGISFDTEASRFSFDVFGFKMFADHPVFKLYVAPAHEQSPVYEQPATHEKQPTNTIPTKTLTGFQMQMLVMHVLTTGVSAPLTGNFKAYRELPWGDVYDHNFNGRCIKRFAFGFGFKPDIFEKAAISLNGTKLTQGNTAYSFDFLGGIKCQLILWKPDDEFPPSAQILFSDNSILMYNAEDLAVTADITITALKELSSK